MASDDLDRWLDDFFEDLEDNLPDVIAEDPELLEIHWKWKVLSRMIRSVPYPSEKKPKPGVKPLPKRKRLEIVKKSIEIKRERGMTQRQFCERVGISPRTLRRWRLEFEKTGDI